MKGDQPPRNGWETRGMREVKVTVHTDGPLVNIPVGKYKKKVTWLIDSGASESVIDEISYRENFSEEELKPMPPELKFKSADGSPLDMLGSFKTPFYIGNEEKEGEVFICKGVARTRLLGTSLLNKFSKWGIDNINSVFLADGETIPLVLLNGNAPKISEVKLYDDINIPPRCSRFVRAVLPQRHLPTEFIFKPDDKVYQRRKLLMPTCLVASNMYDGSITIKVTNPHNERIELGKGTKLGKVSSNLEDFIFSGNESTRNHTINAVRQDTVNAENLERKLKQENPDLFQLYKEAGNIIKGEERLKLLKLLFKYRNVFSVDDTDIGTTSILKHRIVPKSNKIVYRRQYKLSEEQQKQLDKEVDNLLKAGVIKESMSPYNNPVLMVPKKEPGKWRFCLDCRYINDLTEDQYFPIPRIDEAMDSLSGSSIFSVVDMTSGYHQVDLEEESSEMCAFSTRKGHYQYSKLPMGLRGSGMTFQKMVTLLMAGMLHSEVLAYLDDCILYGTTVSQHLRTLEEVLSRFGDAGLKLKPKKCKLFQEELVYLGFLVNKRGIGPNPERAKLIRELPEPKNVRDIQVFLGKVNYYRKFIPNLAQIAHPLYELTESKNRASFAWENVHKAAFNKLKSILCSCQVMAHPRFDREFILDVDASDFALGVELSQRDDNGNERPVFYGSRHLEKSERSYSATARETLAAVFGCEYFSQYLQGRKFVLRTDHNPLVWLRAMKEPKRPYSGWIVRLEQFDYKIEYRPGSKHVNADFNSRIRPPVDENRMRSVGVQVELYASTLPSTGQEKSERKKPYENTLSELNEKKEMMNRESRIVNEVWSYTNAPNEQSLYKRTSNPECDFRCYTRAPPLEEENKVSNQSWLYTNTPGKQCCDKEISLDSRESKARLYTSTPINQNRNTNTPDEQCCNKETTNVGNKVRSYSSTPANQNRNKPEILKVEKKVNEVANASEPLNAGNPVKEEELDTILPQEFLTKLQNEDEDIGPVIKMLLDPKEKFQLTTIGKRLWKIKKSLKIKGQVLFRYRKIRAGLKPIEQVVLPKCLKNMVLESLHDSEFSGHFGTKRTQARVQIRYYWPGYNEDVEDWCKTCLVCQERKNPQAKNTAPLTNIDVGTGPFEQIALDILKLPPTSSGNEHLLVVEDYFTKWVEAFPLKRTAAPSIAHCLLNGWISRFGCPYSILSDQGSEFESHLFKCLNEVLGVNKLRTTAYHPRTDGMVERSNRTIIDILSKYSKEEPDWDLRLPLVLFAIRTSDHATTGFSPFKLVYGQEARIPWDIVYGLAPNNEPLPREEWVAKRKRDMVKLFKMTKDHTLKNQFHQKSYYDRHRRGKFNEFDEGEQIMLCDPAIRAKSGKLNRPWSGPFTIKEKISPALYRITLGNGKDLIVNAERLKRFYARKDDEEAIDRCDEIDTDDEENDELEVTTQHPTTAEDPVIPEAQPRQNPIIAEGQPNPTQGEPLMGHDGKFWCNVDPANIVQGKRRID